MAERRTYQVLGQSRSTQRYHTHVRGDEEALTKTIVRLARKYGRYGYSAHYGLVTSGGLASES